MTQEFFRTVPGDPDGWQRWSPREEIAARFFFEPATGPDGSPVLGLAGQGLAAVCGRWQKTFPVKAGEYYQFTAQCLVSHVAEPARCVLARVFWLDGDGKALDGFGDWPLPLGWHGHLAHESQGRPAPAAVSSSGKGTEETHGRDARDTHGQDAHATHGRDGHATNSGWAPVAGTYPAPEKAAAARVEVHLRWAGSGKALWREVQFRQVPPPAPRKVRLVAINHMPLETKSVQENLDQFGKLLDEAAALKPDIICLPEGVTISGNGRTYIQVAEPVPGPTTEFLGRYAAKLHAYIVAGVIEKDGPTAYNTGVLIGRDGRLVGKYRKTCLPCEEIEGGVTPGAAYPVFDTDFGRIGIMICWDSSYPEVARALAKAGAEVLLVPIAGGNETLVPARAIENQVYIVTSGYYFKTAIYDQAGKTIAVASKDPEIIVAEVDLSRPMVWPWLGDWRARIWHEAPSNEAR